MNDGCGGFENEKVGSNGFPPEIKRWGAGSIYHGRQVTAAQAASVTKPRSCKSVKVNTYRFGLDFVVDAHGQGWQSFMVV